MSDAAPAPADPLGACPGCKKPWLRCSCDATAREWARRNGVDLEDYDDRGRLLGRHENDQARGGRNRQLARLLADMGGSLQRVGRTVEVVPTQGHRLRHWRDWLAARVAAINAAIPMLRQEARMRLFQMDLIDARFDGSGKIMKEIAAEYGRSKTWAVGEFAAIEAEASGEGYVEPVVGRCPVDGAPVVPNETGRPKVFCSSRCSAKARWRRFVARTNGNANGKALGARPEPILRLRGKKRRAK